MRQTRIRTEHHPLQTAFVFFFLIFLLVVGSFVIRMVSVLQQGLFDGDHRFTVLFKNVYDKKTDGLIASFSPMEKSISLLEVQNLKIADAKKNSVLIGVPIDGFVVFQKSHGMGKIENTKEVTALLQNGIKQYKSLRTDLTIVDFVRLWFFANGVTGYNISEKEYILLGDNDSLHDPVLDKIVSSLFTDATISQEKMTIHIMNASGRIGLGSRLARILTNIGGNVIAVSTADQIHPISVLAVSQKDRYTVLKISHFLDIPVIKMSKNNRAISDIVITIGKDKSSLFAL